MITPRNLVSTLAAASALTGCTSLGYGDRYGYGGVSAGYSSGGYDGYYDDAYYDGGGYRNSYYGWYDSFYYPGTGYYVYDRGGRRHSWNAAQRRHWQARSAAVRDRRDNWSDYRREERADRRDDRRDGRREDRRDGRQPGGELRQDGSQDYRTVHRERRAYAPAAGATTAVRQSAREPRQERPGQARTEAIRQAPRQATVQARQQAPAARQVQPKERRGPSVTRDVTGPVRDD